jgi:hypothetical protein
VRVQCESCPTSRAYSDRMDRNTLCFFCIGACPYRKTGVHFSGTCARCRQRGPCTPYGVERRDVQVKAQLQGISHT